MNFSAGLVPIKVQPNRDIWMVSDDVIGFVYTINLAIICGFCSVFGIVNNSINIIVFHRLGFKETINISLFALAVSDTASLLALLWVSICYNPYFMYSELPVIALELQHYPGGWTHVMFTRITGFITVFITLERCLCIAFPLKIKSILNSRRVTVIIIAIYVITIGTMIQNYFVFHMDWKWIPSENKTMLGMVFLPNRNTIESISNYFQMIYPVISFSSVVVCTIIFVWKLNQRSRWLQSASSAQEKTSSSKDQQVIKLVVCVAVIFIVSYIPSLLLFTALSNMPEMNMGRKYENFFILVYSISFPLGAINSSVNIFVYYKMMSKFKATFLTMLCRSKQMQA